MCNESFEQILCVDKLAMAVRFVSSSDKSSRDQEAKYEIERLPKIKHSDEMQF